MKHFLMNWPNPDFKDGFYVEYRHGHYMLGHLTDNKECNYRRDSSHVISRKAFFILKTEAKKNLRRLQRAMAVEALSPLQQGKSLTARIVAKELGVSVVNLSMANIISDSEDNLRHTLQVIEETPVIFNEG